MTLLIDTHVLIWWLTEPEKLSSRSVEMINSVDADVRVSAVSGYEIEFKRPTDPLLQRLPSDLEAAITDEGFNWRPIEPADAIVAGRLPRYHRDPWDRLLIAQAMVSQIPIMTADRAFNPYGVPTLW
ncbi:MAG: PilT protein domain protein [Caulobacter sp.]|nr:PilT protein domain protein [Caulobacter sp.]